MPSSNGFNIESITFDENWNPYRDFKWLHFDGAEHYLTRIAPKWESIGTSYFELDESKTLLLTKCMYCAYCIKLGDGTYRCKCGEGGKPERETCNYERKKR